MKTISLLAVLLMTTGVAHAQSIAPVISEFNIKPGKTAKGSFQIQNAALVPLMFVVEANDFVLDHDGRRTQPLKPSEHVEIFSSSGRLGPKEIRTIEFKVTCDSACNIKFRTGMVIGRTAQGLLVKIWLDHIAYLAQSKHPRHDALTNAGFVIKK